LALVVVVVVVVVVRCCGYCCDYIRWQLLLLQHLCC
jgi:hypothetical protein